MPFLIISISVSISFEAGPMVQMIPVNLDEATDESMRRLLMCASVDWAILFWLLLLRSVQVPDCFELVPAGPFKFLAVVECPCCDDCLTGEVWRDIVFVAFLTAVVAVAVVDDDDDEDLVEGNEDDDFGDVLFEVGDDGARFVAAAAAEETIVCLWPLLLAANDGLLGERDSLGDFPGDDFADGDLVDFCPLLLLFRAPGEIDFGFSFVFGSCFRLLCCCCSGSGCSDCCCCRFSCLSCFSGGGACRCCWRRPPLAADSS
jgi:hypothetical protein